MGIPEKKTPKKSSRQLLRVALLRARASQRASSRSQVGLSAKTTQGRPLTDAAQATIAAERERVRRMGRNPTARQAAQRAEKAVESRSPMGKAIPLGFRMVFGRLVRSGGG